MSRCILIVNPTAGKERAIRFTPELKSILSSRFDTVQVQITKKPGDAVTFAREAALEGVDAVFCMGGDGTINETINGLAQADCGTAFGFIPFGTVNDLARALHIPLDPHHAIEILKTARLLPIDVGKINDHYFINIMAAGTLPDAVGNVSIEEKTRLGSFAYFIKALRVLQHQQSHIFRIETDSDILIRRSPLLAAILTNSIGSFKNIVPDVKVNDGKLRLAVFKDFELVDIIKSAPELIVGLPITTEYVSVLDIKWAKISILSGNALSTNIDGDRGPSFPLELKVLPSYLKVYIPQNAKL